MADGADDGQQVQVTSPPRGTDWPRARSIAPAA